VIPGEKKNKPEPFVSITIPTFNSERTIGYCLSSIFDQDYRTMEVVVIDNGSSDRTERISEKYNCTFLKISSTKAQARKIGYYNSRGDFVLFLDSDMCLEKGILKDLTNLVEDYDLDAIAIAETFPPNSALHIAKNIEKECYTNGFDIQAPRFYRKKILKNVNWDRIDDGWDEYEIFLEASAANLKIGTCQKKIYLMQNPVDLVRKLRHGRYRRLYEEKYGSNKVIARQINFRHRLQLLLPVFKTSYPYGLLVLMIKFSEMTCYYVGSLLSRFFPPRR
jgi:glycosyltransferase involved in cell wall biosynthesis